MSLSVQPPPLPGDHVGDYVLDEVAGVGGMATVYRAHRREATDGGEGQEAVAVKILHPGKASTDEARRFRREFLALLDLHHPGVVQVLEAGVQGDYPWIAMEYVDGTDLGTLVERWSMDPPADRTAAVEAVFRGIVEALAYVHDHGFIHRDLKPSNVLVTRGGVPKLTDFGVVKAAEGAFSTQLTVAGRLVGTVAFMAPEQISGEAIDQRADLYSLGAVLYVLLTGSRPINADSIAGYLARHLSERPRPPSELDPGVSPRLERICLKLLEKDPDQRFASAAQVLHALDRATPVVRAPLHGRDRELDRLMDRARAVKEGFGGLVVVSGPQGSGKSALLDELAVRARAAGVPVVRAHGSRPAPLRKLLEQLLEGEDSTVDTGPLHQRLARRLAGRPQLMILDDLDQLASLDVDTLTRLLREQVAVQGEALLLVTSLSTLEGPVAGLVSGATTGLSPDRIVLQGLDRRGVVAILRDRGLGGVAGAALGTRLADALSGLPGAVIEQLSALEEAGWIERTLDGGLRSVRDVDVLREERLPLPRRVQEVEARRLARLGLDARTVLEALAVLGRESTPGMLARVCGMAPAEVTAAIDTLLAQGLVRRWVDGVQEVVGLQGERQRDAIYSLMDLERRSSLHRQAAVALRGRTRRRVAAMAEVIARHLLHGGQPVEAWPLLIQAAERHFRSQRLSDAHRLLRQALDARPIAEGSLDSAEAARWRRRLYALEGGLLEAQGDLGGARIAWEKSLAAAREEGDAEAEARARAGLGLIQAARGELERAQDDLSVAVASLPQGDPAWPRAAHALARVHLVRGESAEGVRLWEDIAGIGRDAGRPGLVAQASAGLGLAALCQGDIAGGRTRLLDAELRLSEAGNLEELARTRILLAWLALADGRLHRAVELGRDVERLARETQLLDAGIEGLGVAAGAFALRGDTQSARDCARDAVALTKNRGQAPARAALIGVLPVARALVECGRIDEAGAILPNFASSQAGGLEEAQGQLFALRARIGVSRDRHGAVEAALTALDRSPPRLPWLAARLRLDAAHTLIAAEHSRAADAVMATLMTLPRSGHRLLHLEADALAGRLGLGAVYVKGAEERLEELDRELGRPVGFRERWR